MSTADDAKIVLRCLSLANGQPGPAGQFLKSYHVESGFSEWTTELNEAMKFDSSVDALNVYRSVLPSEPVRPWDGRPNRPLTAFTVEAGTVYSFKRQQEEGS